MPPMAIGATGTPVTTVQPIVKTRKNVPMNSTRYLFMEISPITSFLIAARIHNILERAVRRKRGQEFRDFCVLVGVLYATSVCKQITHVSPQLTRPAPAPGPSKPGES